MRSTISVNSQVFTAAEDMPWSSGLVAHDPRIGG
jgi:hypothetical protein